MVIVAKLFFGYLVRQAHWIFLILVLLWRGRLVTLLFLHLASRFIKHPYITRVSISWNSNPGHGPLEERKICWEAPLGITFWSDEGPVFAAAFELHWSGFYIRQLQGVSGVVIPEDLRDWPRRLVSECLSFSRRAGMAEMRLCRAHTSLFYRFPYFGTAGGDEAYEVQAAKHRQRMRRRYDGTARQLGLCFVGKWAIWRNPHGHLLE